MNFSSIQFTPICFGSFNTVSFLFLLVFVLLVEGKGPRCSDGEFDSCAIHAHVTLLREGACISSISAASWITVVDDWDDWFAS
jgi:hypothetical protein